MAHGADDAGREGQVAWRYVKLRDFARISGESFAAQRSREWFAQRRAFNRQKGLTSSQWASLFFVKSQEDFQFRYDVIYNGAKDPPDAMGREAMAWGTKMEDAAILAFLRAHPEYIITEAPFTEAHIPGYAASPDGYYFNTKTLETGCIEVKCPFKKGTKKQLQARLVLLLPNVRPYAYLQHDHVHVHLLRRQWPEELENRVGRQPLDANGSPQGRLRATKLRALPTHQEQTHRHHRTRRHALARSINEMTPGKKWTPSR